MRALPPDFRYVGLAVEPRRAAGQAAVPVASAAVAAGAALHGGWVEGAVVGAAALAALGAARRLAGRRGRGSLALVPWGLIVSEGADLRTLPWGALETVRVQLHLGKDEGTAIVSASVVTVTTAREVFRGVAPGSVGLESLVANLERWSEEADCPVATDLLGEHSLCAEPAEPRFEALGAAAALAARELRGSAPPAVPLGYRGSSEAGALRAVSERLRAVLRAREAPPADPRPLCALVAAELGASSCIPDLLRLVCAPSGFLSLSAKAAALRLGAPLERVGSLDEVAAFVPPEDLDAAAAFARVRGSGPPPLG